MWEVTTCTVDNFVILFLFENIHVDHGNVQI